MNYNCDQQQGLFLQAVCCVTYQFMDKAWLGLQSRQLMIGLALILRYYCKG